MARMSDEPDTPVTQATNVALLAVVGELGKEWLVERDAVIVTVIDAKGEPGEETCAVGAFKASAEIGEDVTDDIVRVLLAATRAALQSVGKDMAVVPLKKG